MKKPPVLAGGQWFQSAESLPYPRFVKPAERSTSAVSALLYRCSRDGWTRQSCLEIVAQCDRFGDGIGALLWLREAGRTVR